MNFTLNKTVATATSQQRHDAATSDDGRHQLLGVKVYVYAQTSCNVVLGSPCECTE